jgi:SPX domain protein involved in polyphosphate accumulation
VKLPDQAQLFRFELKFLITVAQRDRLLAEILGNVAPDPYGGEGGIYRVNSLYYDTPSLTAYWEKIDGEKVRQKYRLRYYGERPDAPFFEIKHRYDRNIRKERVPLKPEKAAGFLVEGRGLQDLGEVVDCREPEDSAITGRLIAAGVCQQVRPVVAITYVRQAWWGRWDPGLRLTFDHHCQALPPDKLQLAGQDRGWPLTCGYPIVMEIKFNERVPLWMVECVNRVGLTQLRFSKYATGVEAMMADRELQKIQHAGAV